MFHFRNALRVVLFRDSHSEQDQHVLAIHFHPHAQEATASVMPTTVLARPPAPLGLSPVCCRTRSNPRSLSPPRPFLQWRPQPRYSLLAKVQCSLSIDVNNENARPMVPAGCIASASWFTLSTFWDVLSTCLGLFGVNEGSAGARWNNVYL